MKNRFAPFGAILSVLAFLAWMSSSIRTDPSESEVEGPLAASAPTNDEPFFRERTGGSAIPCAVPLVWRVARVDESFGLSHAEARAALKKAIRYDPFCWVSYGHLCLSYCGHRIWRFADRVKDRLGAGWLRQL